MPEEQNNRTELTESADAAGDGVQAPQTFDDAALTEVGEMICAQLEKLRGALRFCKEKDANVAKLAGALGEYREAATKSLKKTVALSLIAYREDCRKSLRDLAARPQTLKSVSRYIGYVPDDLCELLASIGAEREDEGEWLFDGEPLMQWRLGTLVPIEVPEAREIAFPVLQATDRASLAEYLAAAEQAIFDAIRDNTALDAVVGNCLENAERFEKGIHRVEIYPVLHGLIRLYTEIGERVEGEILPSLSEENAMDAYAALMTEMIDRMDGLLSLCEVRIDSFVSDVYDTAKQRILKLIPTDDIDLDRKVETRYTDCYLMADRVIYPQKVDIRKYSAS